jgi:hypothetical protein
MPIPVSGAIVSKDRKRKLFISTGNAFLGCRKSRRWPLCFTGNNGELEHLDIKTK